MFFNFANLDTKLMVAILGQDCSLVIQPFSIWCIFVPVFVICLVIYHFDLWLWSPCQCLFGGIWRLLLIHWESSAHWFVSESMLLVQDPDDVDQDGLQKLSVVTKMILPGLIFLQGSPTAVSSRIPVPASPPLTVYNWVPLWCSSTYSIQSTSAVSNITCLFQGQFSTSKRSNFTHPSFMFTSTSKTSQTSPPIP